MSFEVGDAVVHPAHGAGIVTGFRNFKRQGETLRYYTIELLGRADTNVMVPVTKVEKIGIRSALSVSELESMWEILQTKPTILPDDYKKRHKLVNNKLSEGKVASVAEAVRDMAWRWMRSENLTKKGQELYQKGIDMLAGEIAAARGIDLGTAERQVRRCLNEAFEEQTEDATVQQATA